MSLLANAQKLAQIASQLINIATTGKDLIVEGTNKLSSISLWEEASDLASNAAKPEIQPFAEHADE